MSAFELRCKLRDMGHPPVPVCGKACYLDEWQKQTHATPEDFQRWEKEHPDWSNTGVLTQLMPTLDCDIYNPEAAEAIDEWLRLWVDDHDGGILPMRVGQAPKRAYCFRTDATFGKITRKFVDPLGNAHRLEFLANGQQLVVGVIHPITKKRFRWHGDRSLDIPHKDLPLINEAQARALFQECCDILTGQFGFKEVTEEERDGHSINGHTNGPVDAEAELAAMTPDNVNDVHCRAIPSLLWRRIHPNEVTRMVVASTMTMAKTHGLKEWSEEKEIRKHVVPRVKSALKNLFMQDLDPASGEIPSWLCDEFQTAWADALAAGKIPNIGCNPTGFFVRAYDRGEEPAESQAPDPKEAKAPETPQPAAPSSASPQSETTLHRPRFPLIDFAELVPTDEEPYLVEELIPRHGLTVIWGKMKALKSTLTLDLFLHVARGRPYRGLKVQQGRVIYCVFEGSHGYRNRIEALRRHYEIPADEIVPLHLMPASVNLIKDHPLLIAEIKAQLKARGITDMPIAVVLDTLNRSLTGSESNDEDMGDYIKAADKLREAFGAMVTIVHHCGYDETRPRGHSSLAGAIDAQLKVERPERGTTVSVEVELMRDGPEGKVLRSFIKQVEVHVLPDGKVKCSPVLVPDEDADRTAKLPKEMKNPRSANFVRALHEALSQHGVQYQPDLGALPVSAVDETTGAKSQQKDLHEDGSNGDHA